jgi:2'-5' RNA ligase
MNYYNIVLLPPPAVFERAVDYSQKNLKPLSSGYCLEHGRVLPHITLAQCRGEKAFAQEVLHSLRGKPFRGSIVFDGVNLRKGEGQHDGYFWAEMAVQKSDTLMEIHLTAVNILSGLGSVPLNPYGERYHPHLTFARIREEAALPDPGLQRKSPIPGFILAFGHSDKNGRYLESIDVID